MFVKEDMLNVTQQTFMYTIVDFIIYAFPTSCM